MFRSACTRPPHVLSLPPRCKKNLSHGDKQGKLNCLLNSHGHVMASKQAKDEFLLYFFNLPDSDRDAGTDEQSPISHVKTHAMSGSSLILMAIVSICF